MYNKKRRINISKREFDQKLRYVKKYCTILYNCEIPFNIGFKAIIVDKITKLELTFRDPDIGDKCVTYILDKAESAYIHEKMGVEAYSTLQKYYKIPHVATKDEACQWFPSVAGILYHNPKFVNTRNHAYGYDMNSAFSWGMIQDMPKDTEKGPINKDLVARRLKKDEIGFGLNGELITNQGEIAEYIFKREESPFKRFVEVWYDKKKNAKTIKEKIAAKDMLVMCVGFMQRHNFWYRAAIIGYCNNFINNLIKKYPNDILLSNTDSIVSKCRIPEIEANLGKEIGQWKLEHEGEFAYINSNYQWDYSVPTFRGISKSWFKDGFDILKDKLPMNNNIWEFDKKTVSIKRRVIKNV